MTGQPTLPVDDGRNVSAFHRDDNLDTLIFKAHCLSVSV